MIHPLALSLMSAMLLVLVLTLSACARRAPALIVLPHQPDDQLTRPHHITFLEARDQGLIMRIDHPEELDAKVSWSTLTLLRQQGEEPPIVLQSVEMDAARKEAWARQGLRIFDTSMQEGTHYRYAIVLQGEDAGEAVVYQGGVHEVSWPLTPQAPPPPTTLDAKQRGPGMVKLTWPTPLDSGGWETLVVRRELGKRQDAIAQFEAPSSGGEPSGHYVDATVSAPAGYAYRIAHMLRLRIDGQEPPVRLLGQPGAEVYVKVSDI